MSKIPFDPSELVPRKTIIGMGGVECPLYSTPVTPKENYRRLIAGQDPQWVTLSADANMFIPRVVPDNVARALLVDAEPLTPGEGGGKDMFGIEWVYVPVAAGSMVKPGDPLMDDANDWKSLINFPDVDSWEWEHAKQVNAPLLDPDRPTSCWLMTGMFERLISFMDFAGAALAMIDEDQQDAIHELFSALCDTYEKIIDKYIECFDMGIFYFHDDWGSQRAPFFSLNTAREMLVPHFRRLSDYCHSRGVIFELHCCGNNELLVPAMIEGGVDIWDGQDINDKAMLYEKYGTQIILGVQPEPLQEGASDEELQAAAKKYVDTYCSDPARGYVTLGMLRGPQKYSEYIYAYSRQVMGG